MHTIAEAMKKLQENNKLQETASTFLTDNQSIFIDGFSYVPRSRLAGTLKVRVITNGIST